jgi:hypothetical protein
VASHVIKVTAQPSQTKHRTDTPQSSRSLCYEFSVDTPASKHGNKLRFLLMKFSNSIRLRKQLFRSDISVYS